ncbi:predicted protein [Uncinocarpus reesii 1704]|uniref:Aminoglycoside phosphotransferase domain-containing protein n=1 Tax=Uncinocarpus reesii (strain UAMH 1704) TaxID=336963 RepID=C4JZI6_UNCRE|nr:uncharacterized protein UREG_07587 [Uncinocarpus reesii 1704]EEP82722.1 predicted protein [Uncinocarpus reesii 1704]
MLSYTWDDNRDNKDLRTNLFRGLSQVLLALARVPVPRIGSFTINENGFLVLNNRPLSLELHQLESEQIPVDISRNMTYSSVDSYVTDTLAFHDSRLHYQPNAVNDIFDGAYQAPALTVMKATASHFFSRDLRHGPFVYVLNDIHQSNILVDENWNITCLIDLEWACARPIEMLHPPHWLTSQSVDTIDLDLFTPLHQEFVDILEGQESDDEDMSISALMKRGWHNKAFWFSLALMSPTGIFALFHDHIRPRFTDHENEKGYFQAVLKHYWTPGMEAFLTRKVEEKIAYDKKLRAEFDVEVTG